MRYVRSLALPLTILLLARPAVGQEFFDSDGVKIHYTVQGQGEPVLLIHGFAANIYLQWSAPGIVKALAEDYQVIALDNRGHGRSGKPHEPEAYGLNMVEDPIRLLDHLGIEQAHVVGYSMGGFITARLMVDHPDRLRSATLAGAGWAKADDPRSELIVEVADSLEQGKGISPLIKWLNPPGFPRPTDAQLRGIDQMLELTNDTQALAAAMRGMLEITVTQEQLRANRVPALAIVGELDPLRVTVDSLNGVLANSRIEVIDRADHMTAFARPEFVKELKRFLAEQPAPAETQR